MSVNIFDSVAELESNLPRNAIRRVSDLIELIDEGAQLSGWTIQNIDVSGVDFARCPPGTLAGSFFLGCTYHSSAQKIELIEKGAFVFPKIQDLPYNPYRTSLYTTKELLEGWSDGGYKATKDFEIYEFFDRFSDKAKRSPVYLELIQRIHDHAIDDALDTFLEKHSGRGVVGIMGGHNAHRTAPHYLDVAEITWQLTRKGYLIASGGGPGIMEAANMGAYLAAYRNKEVIREAISMLAHVPSFSHARSDTINDYIRSAITVVQRFRSPSEEDAARYGFEPGAHRRSVAVPTWFYGHEPTNLFSDNIAKYFANSIREDGLLAICDAGVVYAPGGAGTLQEVFIDLSQNHYAMSHKRSPMCFLTAASFSTVYQLIHEFVEQRGMESVYGDMIKVVESADEAVEFIETTGPRDA